MDNDSIMDDTSDGAYEIISHDSFTTSDDEGHDSSSNSVAEEDVQGESSVVLGVEHQTAEKTTAEPLSESLETTVVDQRLSTPSLSSSGYGLSPFASKPFLELPSNWVNFKESYSGLGNDDIEVSQTVQYGERREDHCIPTLTVNQTMSKKLLKLDGSKCFHVAYCGGALLKQDVVEKLAGAVDASFNYPRGREDPCSTHQIVRLSYFGENNPFAQVTTVPTTGLAIAITDCTDYLMTRNSPGRADDMISNLEVKDRKMDPQISKLLQFPSRVPDLAVVVHSSVDLNDLSWRQSRALAELGVPVIDINENAQPARNLDRRTTVQPSTTQAVHMTMHMLEAHDKAAVKMPIDLPTFLGLDSLQLNRNMACMTGLRDDDLPIPANRVGHVLCTVQAWLMKVCASINTYAEWWNSCLDEHHALALESVSCLDLFRVRNITSTVVFTAFLLGSLQIWSMLSPQPSVNVAVAKFSTMQNVSKPISASIITVTPTLVSTQYTSAVVLTGTQVPTTHTEYLVSTVTKTIQQPTAARLIPSSVLDFWLYKTDEGRLFLHSAKKLPRKWQPPKNWIEVSQGGNRTTAVYTKFNESTYEVHVDLDETCTPLTVIVQPSKGQHAQKIFQIHDYDTCKARKSWTAALQSVVAWSSELPAIPYLSPWAGLSKARTAGDYAKAMFKHQVAIVGNVTHNAVDSSTSALRRAPIWLKDCVYQKPSNITFPDINQTEALATQDRFKTFRNSSIGLRNFTTKISHSAGVLGQLAKQTCQEGISAYLAAQTSAENRLRGGVEAMKEEACLAGKFLKTDVPLMFNSIKSWNQDVVDTWNRKLLHGASPKPLKTARARIMSLTQKLPSWDLGMRQVIQDQFKRSKNRIENSPAPLNQTEISVPQDRLPAWRRFWQKN